MKNKILFMALFLIVPFSARASVVFTEIMYDPQGTDTKHEWIEVQNTGTAAVDLSKYKLNDGTSSTNHALNTPPLNGGKGSLQLAPNAYAVIADDAATFLSDFPSFTGTVIDSSFSLLNTQATVQFMDCSSSTCVASSSLSYASGQGGSNDGTSLHLASAGVWSAAMPTPGGAYVASLPSSVTGGDATATSTKETSSDPDTTVEQNLNTVTAASSGTGNTTATTTVTTSGGSTSSTSTQKSTVSTFKASITAPKSVTAGVPVTISTAVVHNSGEQVSTGKFRVSFGDGTEYVGNQHSQQHTYMYAGTYVVQFQYSTNQYGESVSDVRVRMNIEVTKPSISASVNKDGSMTLSNTGAKEADLSNWKIVSLANSGAVPFVIPDGTILLAGKSITIANSVMNIPVKDTSVLALALPSGTISSVAILSLSDPSASVTANSANSVKGTSEKVQMVPIIEKPDKNEYSIPSERIATMSEEEVMAQFSAAAIDAFPDIGIPESSASILVFIAAMIAVLCLAVFLLRRVVSKAGAGDLAE